MNTMSQMLEKYNCEKCRFSTKDVNKYKIHIALHNEMKYVCSHCNFESYTKTEFQRHLVSHTGKFPYTCEYCGYGAIRNDYIVKHIKRIHGDGKIQCSVSTVENESKNASVNIMQTQMKNSLQEILPNNTTLIAKNLLDLTHELGHSNFNNRCHLNGNGGTRADQVEVEVISPTDQQLSPCMPLTVIAPAWFKVPENCFAQVVEVKPVNSTYYLVLKCSEVVDSNGPIKDKNTCEQNTLEPMITSEKDKSTCEQNTLEPMIISEKDKNTCEQNNSELMVTSERDKNTCEQNTLEPMITSEKDKSTCEQNTLEPMIISEKDKNTCEQNNSELMVTSERDKNTCEQNTLEPMITSENGAELSDGASLLVSDVKSLLPTKDVPTQENPKSITSELNDNEIISALHDDPNGIFDETEEVTDGPIISSVFSLSSGAHNVIEGIQWESPIVNNTNESKDIVDATPSLNGIKSQGEPQILENEAKSLVENVTACEPKAGLENEQHEADTMEVKNTGPEIQLPLDKSVLPYGKKPESQTSAFAQSNQREGRKSNRLSKIETNLFSKPQKLFLSCDKRIVMQPLSCVMQTGNKADGSRENELVPLKVKKQSAKPKGKRLAAPALKTLRLCPLKADQLTQTPHKNQPVVVLNHPEMESLEVSSIMKAISMFKGMVLKVTLSKQTRRKVI